jgi:outer membrane lipoprotein-sorting protein
MSSFHRSFPRVLSAVLLGLVLMTGHPAIAALSTADETDIQKAEQALNAVTTLKAHFLQVSAAGDTVEGTAYLSRPGKMRLEYDPPSPILVVCDGSFLIYYDKQLKETSYVGIDSTPAGVLVRPQVKLNEQDLEVTKVSHQPGILQVTVIRRSEPHQGQITLVFSEGPFQLKQWRVVDQQGQTTTVSLYDVQTGMTLDPKLFVFRDPKMDIPLDQINRD